MKDIHGGDIWEASRKSKRPPETIIDFSASINPAGLPPAALAALRRALGLIPSYPDPFSSALKEALSGFHGVDAGEVLPGNGSTELIYLIPSVIRPERALIIEPAFSEYRRSIGLFGCKAEGFVLREGDGWSLDTGRLEPRLKNGYDIVYIANPANPTGALSGKGLVLELAGICRKAGSWLVVDEAFADFSEDESIKKEAVKFKNLIILRSMTKFFSMAGLRLGFLIGHRSTVKRLSSAIPPWSVNTLAASAAIGAVSDPAYIGKTMRWLAREREFLFRGISGIRGLKPFPSGANFLMVRIDSGGTSGGLREKLFRKGILIRDLSAFRGLGPEYFRVAVRKREENLLLIRGLEEALSGC